jgi:hypothetical protein
MTYRYSLRPAVIADGERCAVRRWEGSFGAGIRENY